MLTSKMRARVTANWKGLTAESKKIYLSRVRKGTKQALADLALIAGKAGLSSVFTAEEIRDLVIALTPPRRKEDSADLQRQYEIAALLMERGVLKCLESVSKPYKQYIERDAWRVIELLKTVTVGHGGHAAYV